MESYDTGQIFYGVMDRMLVECRSMNYDINDGFLYFKSTKSERFFRCPISGLGHSLFTKKEDAKSLCKYEEGQVFYHVDAQSKVRMCKLLRYDSKSQSMTFRDYHSKTEFQGDEKNIGKTLFDSVDMAAASINLRDKKKKAKNNTNTNTTETSIVHRAKKEVAKKEYKPNHKKVNESRKSTKHLEKKKSVAPTSATFGFTYSSSRRDWNRKKSRPAELPKALQGKGIQNYKEDT